MREAGYDDTTAKNPKNLTHSKSWPELMEQYLPDKLLARKHKLLLNAKKKVRKFVKGDLTTEHEEEDRDAIARGLDMAYKLKGKYAAEKRDVKVDFVTPILGGSSKKDVRSDNSNKQTE